MRFWIAIGLGLGLAPVAPGTVGSLGGLLLVWLLWPLGGTWAVAAGTVAVVVVALWSAGAGVAISYLVSILLFFSLPFGLFPILLALASVALGIFIAVTRLR